MNKKQWKQTGFWILAVEAVGALSGLLSADGIRNYSQMTRKPALTPSPVVFPVVWALLYGLLGFSASRVWMAPPSTARNRGLNLFVAQLTFNFFWSLLFFGAQAFGFAALWLALLWVLVVLMALLFFRVDPPAGWFQIPYILWLTFAGYLNIAVWLLNR